MLLLHVISFYKFIDKLHPFNLYSIINCDECLNPMNLKNNEDKVPSTSEFLYAITHDIPLFILSSILIAW